MSLLLVRMNPLSQDKIVRLRASLRADIDVVQVRSQERRDH